jgi:hypothetical protein
MRCPKTTSGDSRHRGRPLIWEAKLYPQHRLMRAARAFLDIELQTGKITRDQALAIPKNDNVLSDAMANQEVERYTF